MNVLIIIIIIIIINDVSRGTRFTKSSKF